MVYRRSEFKRKRINSGNRGSFFKKMLGTLFALLLIVLLVGIAGFLFFTSDNGGSRWGTEKLVFEVDGPKEISSGEFVEYKINLENKGNVNLNNNELSVSFPDGFILNEATPELSKETSSGGSWEFSEMKSYEIKTYTIRGQLFGDINETKVISFAMSYRPDNFSSSFLETLPYETKIKDSLLSLSLILPDEIMNGREVESTIKITQPQADAFSPEKLLVIIENLNSFDLLESSYPEKATGVSNSKSFVIDNFGNSATLNLKGIFYGENNERKNLVIRLYSLGSDDKQSPEITQLRETIYLTKPDIRLSFEADKSLDAKQGYEWGRGIDFEINYQNNWDRAINDLVLRVSFEGDDVFDWDSVRFFGDFNRSATSEVDRGQLFIFNKLVLPEFEKIDPGKSGVVRFRLTIKETTEDISQAKVLIKPELLINDFKIESNQIELTIN